MIGQYDVQGGQQVFLDRYFVQTQGVFADRYSADDASILEVYWWNNAAIAKLFAQKFNDNHDEHGRFGSGNGAPASLQEMKKAYATWQKGLTPAEIRAFRTYTGKSPEMANEQLRAGGTITAAAQRVIDPLTSALSKSEAPRDLTVYRGMKFNLMDGYKAGDTFIDKGFPSTSLSYTQAKDFAGTIGATIATISVSAGQQGAYIGSLAGQHEDEQEFLLPSNSAFRIDSLSADPIASWRNVTHLTYLGSASSFSSGKAYAAQQETHTGDSTRASRVKNDQQGNGIGTQMLVTEADQASALGVTAIKVEAEAGEGYNGYYTWARLGYNAPVSSLATYMPDWATSEKTLSDVMALPATADHPSGASWWKDNGVTWQGTFDLTPGSRSLQILHSYADARGIVHKAQGDVMSHLSDEKQEEIPWSDEDDAIAERVWVALAAKWNSEKKSKELPDPQHTCLMVAFFLDHATAEQLALPGYEKPEDLHVTLAMLGERDQYSSDDIFRLREDLLHFANEMGPITGKISGIGRFTSVPDGEPTPVYASVDCPGLPDFRGALAAMLDDTDFTVDETHGFTPHITLCYIDTNAPMPVEDMPELAVRFTSLWLASGEERYEMPLAPEMKFNDTHESDGRFGSGGGSADISSRQPSAAFRAAYKTAQDSAYQTFAAAHAMTVAAYRTAVNEHTQKLLATASPMLRISPQGLSGVLETGHVMNAFERNATLGKSEGVTYLDPVGRAKMEQTFFGYDPAAAKETYPNYGYLSTSPTGTIAGKEIASGRYGSVVLQLDDSVRATATVTANDSLNITHMGRSPNLLPEPLTRPNGDIFPTTIDPLTVKSVNSYQPYFELQFHSGVPSSAIKSVYFTSRGSTTYERYQIGELQDALAKAGIPYTFKGGK